VSELEETLAFHLDALKIDYRREYKFGRDLVGNPKKGIREALAKRGLKDWRFDFAIPNRRIAAEVEGGAFTGGRHTRGAGFTADCRKYNRATLEGWRVLRFTGTEIKNGVAITEIEEALRRL
jgi:hypothetical protein